jgi:hypothetical protein
MWRDYVINMDSGEKEDIEEESTDKLMSYSAESKAIKVLLNSSTA